MAKYRGKKLHRFEQDRGAWAYKKTTLGIEHIGGERKPDPAGAELFKQKKIPFEVTVPEDFNKEVFIKSFIKELRVENPSPLLRFSAGYSRKKYGENAVCELVPGKTYDVIIYKTLKRGITKTDCLNFIKATGGVCTGAEGLGLVYQKKRGMLWGIQSLLSFNDPNVFLKDDKGTDKVPCLYHHRFTSRLWQLLLIDADSEYGRSKQDCLLVFYEKK